MNKVNKKINRPELFLSLLTFVYVGFSDPLRLSSYGIIETRLFSHLLAVDPSLRVGFFVL